jgi:hypothetical protein
MFSTLCDNHQFFKDKLKLFVAIAPVVGVKNLQSQLLKDQA